MLGPSGPGRPPILSDTVHSNTSFCTVFDGTINLQPGRLQKDAMESQEWQRSRSVARVLSIQPSMRARICSPTRPVPSSPPHTNTPVASGCQVLWGAGARGRITRLASGADPSAVSVPARTLASFRSRKSLSLPAHQQSPPRRLLRAAALALHPSTQTRSSQASV